MNDRLAFQLIKILALLLTINMTGMAQKARMGQERIRAAPRYVIVYDTVDPSLGEGDSDRRFLEILMDSRSFSKGNVAVVGELVSNRFLDPSLLYINIFTSLYDVETPEERDEPKISNSSSEGPKRKDAATCVRIADDLRCSIYFGNGKHDEVQVKLSKRNGVKPA